MRRAAKPDDAQPKIVKALREAGCRVEIIRQPVDLLVRFWSNKYRHFIWTPMEIKTPTKTGKRRKRLDQKAQDDFIAETGTPVVLTKEEALEVIRGMGAAV